MFGFSGTSAKKREPAGPMWKRLLRAALISAGTALVVTLVDMVLFPKPTAKDGEDG